MKRLPGNLFMATKSVTCPQPGYATPAKNPLLPISHTLIADGRRAKKLNESSLFKTHPCCPDPPVQYLQYAST